MRNIVVEKLCHTPIEEQKIELVERKGVGHPDSLADGIAEAMSKALCKEYLKKFDAILHHNTDETQIVAGDSKPEFGGGEIIKPIFILLVGRATKYFENEVIPTDRIALKAAKEYLKSTIRNLNIETDVTFDVKLGEGSAELKDVFIRGEIPHANDTSFGIGYAPLSETEKLVYNIEREIYNKFRKKERAIGEDVKVMALREGDKIELTVACAFVSKYLNNLEEYKTLKSDLTEWIKDIASSYTSKKVEVFINTADNYKRGVVYITVTGTSAENADDGSVGRGNRCNGLITPGRPMSLEATSGKNPVNHVGKIYNLLATQIAKDCYENIDGIKEVYVRILSQIGKPINEPRVLSIQVIPETGYDVEKMESKLKNIANEWLDGISKITDIVMEGKLSTF